VIDTRLLVCAVGSVLFHYGLERGLEQLPPLGVAPPPPQKIEVQVIEPEKEPPPEPPKPEEPKPIAPEPKPVPHEVPHAQPAHASQVAAVSRDTPPPEHPAVTTDTTDEPVYGVNMSSTSTVGTGPQMQVGNTMKPAPAAASSAPVKPLAEPIAAAEATKLPLPQGQCFGKYTDDARAAGVEGTVVLDLIVGEDGHVRDVRVAQGLPHGLSEAAVAALRDCRFTPGERDGKPVPVRVRGFKIHFVLDTGP
jgi:protein TonB